MNKTKETQIESSGYIDFPLVSTTLEVVQANRGNPDNSKSSTLIGKFQPLTPSHYLTLFRLMERAKLAHTSGKLDLASWEGLRAKFAVVHKLAVEIHGLDKLNEALNKQGKVSQPNSQLISQPDASLSSQPPISPYYELTEYYASDRPVRDSEDLEEIISWIKYGLDRYALRFLFIKQSVRRLEESPTGLLTGLPTDKPNPSAYWLVDPLAHDFDPARYAVGTWVEWFPDWIIRNCCKYVLAQAFINELPERFRKELRRYEQYEVSIGEGYSS